MTFGRCLYVEQLTEVKRHTWMDIYKLQVYFSIENWVIEVCGQRIRSQLTEKEIFFSAYIPNQPLSPAVYDWYWDHLWMKGKIFLLFLLFTDVCKMGQLMLSSKHI